MSASATQVLRLEFEGVFDLCDNCEGTPFAGLLGNTVSAVAEFPIDAEDAVPGDPSFGSYLPEGAFLSVVLDDAGTAILGLSDYTGGAGAVVFDNLDIPDPGPIGVTPGIADFFQVATTAPILPSVNFSLTFTGAPDTFAGDAIPSAEIVRSMLGELLVGIEDNGPPLEWPSLVSSASATVQVTVVPLPAGCGLLCMGIGVLARFRRAR